MSAGRRPLGDLLAETLRLYRAHAGLVLTIAGGVAVTVELILGLGLGDLDARYHSTLPTSTTVIQLAASALVTTPLITAMLAHAVLDVRAWREPSARRAAQAGLDAFGPLLVAIVLYAAVVVLGASAFVLPGIYVGVLCYFVPQAVVVDGFRGPAALARSAELVRGGWWHAAGTGVAFNIAVVIAGSLVQLAFAALAKAANAEAVVLAGDALFATVALSFVAIGATLYYLDLPGR